MSVVRLHLVPPHPLGPLADALWYVAQAIARPRTREDCRNAPRPCPWATCQYHLLGEITDRGSYRVRAHDALTDWRSKTINPDHKPDHRMLEDMASVLSRLPDTCMLDVIERAEDEERDISTAEVAALLRLSAWRTRQEERSARSKLKNTNDEEPMTRSERKRRTAAYQAKRANERMTSATRRTNPKLAAYPHHSAKAKAERAALRKAKGGYTKTLAKHFAKKRLKKTEDSE